ncbi:MAG: DUF192 domain-containing protein [Candidatus Omnitrophota bacterium]|nr:DUF192 domain-containing protein [Candidatus Omnitrophota bacterium]
MKIINQSNSAVLADRARVADTFYKRLVGLLNRNSLEKGEALILKPCSSIHTLFMRFPIDVLFLDKNGKVIGLLSVFRPFRFSPVYFGASLAIELLAGTIQLTQTKLGNIIKIE